VASKGTVPEVDPDATGLTSHVVKQVRTAVAATGKFAVARVNFRCRGVMLLGTASRCSPCATVRMDATKSNSAGGDMIFNEERSMKVSIAGAPALPLQRQPAKTEASQRRKTRPCRGPACATAIVDGRKPDVKSKPKWPTQTVRSVFVPEHERIGKRVLGWSEKIP